MDPFAIDLGTSRSPSPPAMVMVVIAWGERVIHAGAVASGGACALGELPGDIPMPSAVLGQPRVLLVAHRAGQPAVIIPRRSTGSVALEGHAARSIDQLRPAGTHRHMAPAATEIWLPVGAVVRLELDPITVVVSRPRIERGMRPRRGLLIDRRLAACHALAAISLVALLASAAAALPKLGETAHDVVGPDELVTRYVLGVGFDGAAVSEPAMGLARDSEVPSTPWVPGSGTPCRCHPTGGGMGCPEGAPQGRYGVMGPIDNADPHLAREKAPREATNFWHAPYPVGPDPGLGGDPAAPTTPWGGDDSLGTDALSARGHLWDDAVRDALGEDGIVPDWPEGGLVKTIEQREERRPADGLEPAPALRVAHTGLQIRGSLSRGAVLQILAPRLLGVRACYREGLERTPDLHGRVDVVVEIPGADGRATRIRVVPHGLPDTGLVGCITAAFAGVSFPRGDGADGAGAEQEGAIVTYPIWLSAGASS